MKKQIYVLVVGIIVIAGLYLFSKNFPNKSLSEDVIVPVVTISDIDYFSGAKGFFVKPEKEGKYPGIVMIHDSFGLRQEVRFMAEELSKRGYKVLAVDLFGQTANTESQARQLVSNVKQEEALANMRGAIALLKRDGITRLGSIGWGFGGEQSLALAMSEEKMNATVIYYGSLLSVSTSTDRLSNVKWPVLAIFAENDLSISTDSVKAFGDALTKLKIKNEIYVYPEVGRGFANPAGANYAPQETSDAWGKTLKFFRTHLK